MLILTNNVKIKENDETTLEIEVINTDMLIQELELKVYICTN